MREPCCCAAARCLSRKRCWPRSTVSPREAREVGEACAANRLAVVVPCHRIVKKDGSISGYRWGVRRKRALLEREHRARLLRPSEAVPHGAAST